MDIMKSQIATWEIHLYNVIRRFKKKNLVKVSAQIKSPKATLAETFTRLQSVAL